MKIGIPKESLENETRVAAVPETVAKMLKNDLEVCIETGAGNQSYISDEEYKKAGARIESNRTNLLSSSDIVLRLRKPPAPRFRRTNPPACGLSSCRTPRWRMSMRCSRLPNGRTTRRY